jgi:hypothetical protein
MRCPYWLKRISCSGQHKLLGPPPSGVQVHTIFLVSVILIADKCDQSHEPPTKSRIDAGEESVVSTEAEDHQIIIFTDISEFQPLR